MVMVRNRNVDPKELTFHDLVAHVIELRLVKNGYADLGINLPDWLKNRVDEAERTLKHERQAYKERKLVDLRTRREGLLTPTEKRERLDKEIEALAKELETPST